MTAHVLAASVIPARAQMGATLGFHIIFACFGIAMPAIVLLAHWRGLRHGDAVSLLLARRWSKVMAVLFAVGAVSGTVLSYELGLLWPKLMGIFGPAFGIPFSVEAIWFFVEAIFTAIYLYGWRRLPAWLHWWTGVPLVVSGVLGAFSVVAANAWMNQPSGFTLSHGRITHVDPWAVIFNKATPYEVPHMILAAYMVAGFTIAGVYAVGLLRGRRDRYHRLGFIYSFATAAVCAPIQVVFGDFVARAIEAQQPQKFAAMELVSRTHAGVTEWIGGIYWQRQGLLRHRHSRLRLPARRVLPAQDGHRLGRRAAQPARPAARPDPPELRSDGRARHAAAPAGGLAGLVRPVPAPAADDALVPDPGRGGRAGRDHRHGGRLDRHRGRPPALGRLRLPASPATRSPRPPASRSRSPSCSSSTRSSPPSSSACRG